MENKIYHLLIHVSVTAWKGVRVGGGSPLKLKRLEVRSSMNIRHVTLTCCARNAASVSSYTEHTQYWNSTLRRRENIVC